MTEREKNGRFRRRGKEPYIEDLMTLATTARRIFQRIDAATEHGQTEPTVKAKLVELPDIDAEAAEAAGGIEDTLIELDQVRAGNTEAHWALADWYGERVVSKTVDGGGGPEILAW